MLFTTRKVSFIILIILALLIIVYFCFYAITMKNVKEPPYQLIARNNGIEQRYYPPMLLAEVEVTGARDEAIKAGFRELADYIFGNNVVAGSNQNSKIAMTAPVLQQNSTKIAMTAPVIQTPAKNGVWQVRFVMPAKYTLTTLPKPNNNNIKIYEQPAFKAIVIRFSGSITQHNLDKHLQKLERYVTQHQINVVAEPIYAFYNPPWTLPFMRRNEILFKLKDD